MCTFFQFLKIKNLCYWSRKLNHFYLIIKKFILIYFTVNLTDANAEVYVDGEKAEVIDNKVYTKDIKATGFEATHTAEIKINGVVVSKVEYNVNAYINSKNTSSSIGELVKALNNYGVSAVEYGK